MIDWQERKTYIGASESAAILGMHPWLTAFDIWAEKVDYDGGKQYTQEENERMLMGSLLESAIIKAYEQKYNRKVSPCKTFKHPNLSYIAANPDGLEINLGLNIECKNVDAHRAHIWGEQETDQIPPYYIIQVQKQMGLSGMTVTEMPVLFGGNELKRYIVPADAELYKYIIEADTNFYNSYLKPWFENNELVMPPVTQLKDIQRAYPKSLQNALTAKQEIILAVESLKEIKKQLAELETAKDEQEAVIKGFLQENDTLVNDERHVLATWKSAKGSIRFDAKKFEDENPELYQKYTYATNGARRFLLK